MFLKPATGPVGIILYSHLDLSQPIKLGPQLLKSIQMLNSGIMQMLSKKQTWAFTAAILFFLFLLFSYGRMCVTWKINAREEKKRIKKSFGSLGHGFPPFFSRLDILLGI